jgi:nicotinamidase-related amidase
MGHTTIINHQERIIMNYTLRAIVVALALWLPQANGAKRKAYSNTLVPIRNPKPILADYPQYVAPVLEETHYQSPPLVQDPQANLEVRAWRFSYNARGIVEIPNKLDGSRTAVICVHPWGVDDGQGWNTPEPAGVAFGCTPTKNAAIRKHAGEIINPFLKRMRPHVNTILYSLPRDADAARLKAYRSINYDPTASERVEGKREMYRRLDAFDYTGHHIPPTLNLSADLPVVDYFKQFPGIDASDHYNRAGFWQLPIPVIDTIDVHPNDIVLYDNQGYPALRDYLKNQGIRHILMVGYATDMCVCSTTAGYENLRRDFNVFLVGDATQATFPANKTAANATNQSISYAALNLLITQVSWIKSPRRITRNAPH